MVDPVGDLRRDYTPRFLSYLTHLDERGLSSAYELGRQAIDRGIGLLDVVRVHNEVYLDVMSTARSVDEAQGLAEAATSFLLEALSPYEMTQRAFMAGEGLTRPPAGPGVTR